MKNYELHDDVMAKIFKEDPEYAIRLLNQILEDGDQAELMVYLSIFKNK